MQKAAEHGVKELATLKLCVCACLCGVGCGGDWDATSWKPTLGGLRGQRLEDDIVGSGLRVIT